ncbi:MAG: dTDP-4-dehydrorhamnose reductase [Gordonia sp. (in: high G+C Gram-positive bacteria)]
MAESDKPQPSVPTGRVWIVGAAGQLGRALGARVPAHREVRGLTSADVDIADPASVRAAFTDLNRADVVINCAAYTNVDAAESEPQRAAQINAAGPGNLAAVTAAAGAWLIHLSTDYVFGGRPAGSTHTQLSDAQLAGCGRRVEPYEPDDVDPAVRPETIYGATKLDGERAALAADPAATIIRTAWVYTGAPGSRDFVGTIRRLESERESITVVDDQTGSPTYAGDLADGLWELAAHPRDEAVSGRVLHATNAGVATWFDVARAVFAELGADPDRVRPVCTDEFPRPAPRPAYSVLSPTSWITAGLTPLRDWRAALSAALSSDAVAAR